jgi:hypothetical protein
VAAIIRGKTDMATRPSFRSVMSSTMAMPTSVASETTALSNPFWTRFDSVSTSLITLVRMRPVSSFS